MMLRPNANWCLRGISSSLLIPLKNSGHKSKINITAILYN